MTRKILFILLAIVLTIIEVLLKAIVDALMGWKSGGGAIPMVLFLGLLVLTWKSCLKWAKGKQYDQIKDNITPLTVTKESEIKKVIPTTSTSLKVKKFIAKETLILLSLVVLGGILILYFNYQYKKYEPFKIGNYSESEWYKNLFHKRIGFLNEPEGSIDSFNEDNQKLWRLFNEHDKPYSDKQELTRSQLLYSYFSILFLIYPIRILYYLILWCIKTLKTS